MLEDTNNYGEMNQGIDRITQILQQQAAPTSVSPYQPQATQLPDNILNALASASYDYGDGGGGNFVGNAQKYEQSQQNNQLAQQEAVLKTYEMKLKMGDAQAKALDDKLKLFTGDDPEGKALFLQALHDDPDPIDPTNSYQVMTKLAAIKKKTGYESPDLQLQKAKEIADIQLKQAEAGKNNAAASSNTINFGPSSQSGNSLSIINNNPGNMRPPGSSSGFQQFPTPQAGIDAMKRDLTLKITGNSPAMAGKQPTLTNLITTWAPPTENNTMAYIKNVSQQTGIAPDQMLTPNDIDKLIPAMVKQEGGAGAAAYFANQTAQPSQDEGPKPIFKGNVPYTEGLDKGYQWAMDPSGKYVSIKVPEYIGDGEKKMSPTDQMSSTIGDLAKSYQELHKLGADVSTENSWAANKFNQAKLSEGLSIAGVPIIPSGQTIMKGTKQQAIVDKIGAGISGLLLDIKSASGAGAKQFDSDKDVQFMKQQASSPTNSYEANMQILDNLSRKYTGKPLDISNLKVSSSNTGGWSVRQVN